MPDDAPAWTFRPKTFLTSDHLAKAGLSAFTVELRDSTASTALYALTRPKGPGGQLQVEVKASDNEARRLAQSLADLRRPHGESLKALRQPDFVWIDQEPFVPDGTFIRTIDFIRTKNGVVMFLRLEETGRDDAMTAAAALERSARALLDQLAK